MHPIFQCPYDDLLFLLDKTYFKGPHHSSIVAVGSSVPINIHMEAHKWQCTPGFCVLRQVPQIPHGEYTQIRRRGWWSHASCPMSQVSSFQSNIILPPPSLSNYWVKWNMCQDPEFHVAKSSTPSSIVPSSTGPERCSLNILPSNFPHHFIC
jgi:hypothetical protein